MYHTKPSCFGSRPIFGFQAKFMQVLLKNLSWSLPLDLPTIILNKVRMADESSVRDTDEYYCGPIIDSHHHLWDLSLFSHPWLSSDQNKPAALSRNQLPEQYLTASARHNVIATVHIEAGWDPKDPLGELNWLDTLHRPNWMANRYVSHAQLANQNILDILDKYTAHPRVVGIREILSKSREAASIFENMDDPVWRRGMEILATHDLSFDLLIMPWQFEAALRLVNDFPQILFILNHCGAPIDRTKAGLADWENGLRSLAKAPNIVLKVSDMFAYDHKWTLNSISQIVLACVNCFGVDRIMLASDHPVETLYATFDSTYNAFKKILKHHSAIELQKLFCSNAAQYYKMAEIQFLDPSYRESSL